MARGIPRETQAFIRRHISSIHQLEALLWLRESRQRRITPDLLAKEQRLEPGMARDLIALAVRSGFLTGSDEGGYRYEPSSELDSQVAKLGDVYGTYRVSVVNFVFSMPSESVQSFADAFRIRKEDDAG